MTEDRIKDNSINVLSRKRIVLFKLISIVLIPLLILVFAELCLRVFNYGDNLNLFIEAPNDARFWMMNPDASKRYFTTQTIATTGNKELFAKVKAPNTIRIFVLGESTTIGYPYFHNGSFHRWLQYRLMHTYPDKNFEIINLSLTAVNSYTVLGFAREVVNYQPDAVLIYAGHNEYYGAMGVGSTQAISGNPQLVNFILQLRAFKLVQLFSNLYQSAGKLAAKNGGTGESRMQLMVASQQITYKSDLYNRGIEQFKYNIDETIKLFNDHHVPVLVSNLVSNEKDLKPFIDIQPNYSKYPDFEKNYKLGVKAYQDKDYNAAIKYLQAANQQYNGSALCNYYLGKLAYEQSNYTLAKSSFDNAQKLDALRFRASDELNATVPKLCNQYSYAHLVNTKAAFEASADNHIIGDALMTDHVHPNLKGYAVMSDVFYQQLKKAHVLPAGGSEMTFDQLTDQMPLTKVDSLAGDYRIANLKTKWPYTETAKDTINAKSVEQQLAYAAVFNNESWATTTDNLYSYYISEGNLQAAKKVVEGVVLEYPTREEVYEKPAMINARLNDFEEAAFYFKKAFEVTPSFDKARYLFVLYLDMDKPILAMPYIDYAIAHNQSTFNLSDVKTQTAQIIGLQKGVNEASNVNTLNQIAACYIKMNNKIAAAKYVQKVLKIDKSNAKALAMLPQTEIKEVK
jgi:tetratricopeptide (TPR) repeat protein